MVKATSMSEMDKRYQAEDDARTMMRVMEITKDKERHAACLKEMEKQQMRMDNAMSVMKDMNGGKMSPQDFDMCVKDGGKVHTKAIKGGRMMKICFDKMGKSHAGEVQMAKQAKNMMGEKK